MLRQSLAGGFEYGDRSLAIYRGEVLKEIFQRRRSFKVVEEGFDEHACPGEAQCSAHDLRIAFDKR